VGDPAVGTRPHGAAAQPHDRGTSTRARAPRWFTRIGARGSGGLGWAHRPCEVQVNRTPNPARCLAERLPGRYAARQIRDVGTEPG